MSGERPTVVIPYARGCEWRARALEFVLEEYADNYQWRVLLCECDGVPWIKANPVWTGLEAAETDIVVVADADVWCPQVPAAITAVAAGVADWAVPHYNVHRLDPEHTEAITSREWVGPWHELPTEERPYVAMEGGGIVVARREVLLDCPLDPRFVGWGQEDDCWGVALRELHGPPWRGGSPVMHLWHPPQERWTRNRGSRESWLHRVRYYDSRDNPTAMRHLIEEAHGELRNRLPGSDLHSHPQAAVIGH